MASPKAQPDTGPKTVKVGNVKIRVRPWQHPKRPAPAPPYWRFTYTDQTGRECDVTRADRAEALHEASRIARTIHNGAVDLTELPPDKLRMVRAFLDLNPTWADLERLGAERRAPTLLLQDAIAQFIAWKVAGSAEGKTRHLTLTESDLNAMAAEIGPDVPLARIRAQQLAEWLDELDVQWKRRKDYRAACVALWRWARRQELIHVPGDLTEPEKLPVPQGLKQDSVRIPSLAEYVFMFHHVSPAFLPWLAICSQSGVRSGELRALNKEPLDVSALKLDRGIIDMPASIAKNRKRRLIPISKTLTAWLKACKLPKTGPIIQEPAHVEETARLGKLLDAHFGREEGWPNNCLRHLYGSVRVAETHDIAKTSLEMDNSPKVIKDHYLEAMTPKEAAAYLRVLPGTLPELSRKLLKIKG